MSMTENVHPELSLIRYTPAIPVGDKWVKLLRFLSPTGIPSKVSAAVSYEHSSVPGLGDAPEVPVLIVRPSRLVESAPAIMWIHGGGMVLGSHTADFALLHIGRIPAGSSIQSTSRNGRRFRRMAMDDRSRE
jgi:hypothetical protein